MIFFQLQLVVRGPALGSAREYDDMMERVGSASEEPWISVPLVAVPKCKT